jgi:peptidoglycan hydrolase-like protein with peptidoglycan-binding domain
VWAAFGCAALPLAGAVLAAQASETVDQAVATSDDQEEPDGPDLDETQLEDLVADAQRLLNLSGYDPGPIDGQLGLRTQRAIRAYQAAARRHGTLEALKGPAVDDRATPPELVGMGQPASSPTR